MLLTLSDACSRTVARFDKSWSYIGWTLWVGWFLTPYLVAPIGAVFWVVWLSLTILLALWWACDALDQQVAWWQFVLGILMLGIGFLPRGGILAIACWIVYWTKVRE